MSLVTRFFTILLFIFLPLKAFSQDYANKAVIEYKGQTGYFFAEEVGDRILSDLIEFKDLKEKLVPQLQLKLEAKDREISLLKQELDLSDALAAKWEDSYNKSESLRISEVSALMTELDKKRHWYESPTFMLSIGFVSGALACIGMAFGLAGAY